MRLKTFAVIPAFALLLMLVQFPTESSIRNAVPHFEYQALAPASDWVNPLNARQAAEVRPKGGRLGFRPPLGNEPDLFPTGAPRSAFDRLRALYLRSDQKARAASDAHRMLRDKNTKQEMISALRILERYKNALIQEFGEIPGLVVKGVLNSLKLKEVVMPPDRETRAVKYSRLVSNPELLPKFSAREQQVLGLMIAGRTNPEIAAQLEISPSTVRGIANSVNSKFGFNNLTSKELNTLRLFDGGSKFKDVANEHHINPYTLKRRLDIIFYKLGVHNIMDALHAIPDTLEETEKNNQAVRQQEIWRYRSYKLSNLEIAYILGISNQTVNNLFRSIFMKSPHLKSFRQNRSAA